MEIKKRDMKVIVISGKARAGKDTTMMFMKEIFEKYGKDVINLQYSSSIKEYAKKISDWDGSEDTKPRELLQALGTEIIREKIDEEFFIKRMIQDVQVYCYFYDIVIISDARLKLEIERIRETFNDVISVNIERPLFDNNLNVNEKSHRTEVDLDNYSGYDYVLINDGSLDDLKDKVVNLVDSIL